jgi:hypothetical protein
MKTDLVQKLRTWKGKALTHVVLNEAADEIERLRLLAAKNVAVAKPGDLIIIKIPENFSVREIAATIERTEATYREFRFLFVSEAETVEVQSNG